MNLKCGHLAGSHSVHVGHFEDNPLDSRCAVGKDVRPRPTNPTGDIPAAYTSVHWRFAGVAKTRLAGCDG